MAIVIRKLTVLGFEIGSIIDKGGQVTTDAVQAHINRGTIFAFLESHSETSRWALNSLTENEKRHLLGEWRSMVNAIDSERKLGVTNNGFCLMSAYVLEGIQMRTFSKKLWPGPEPFEAPYKP